MNLKTVRGVLFGQLDGFPRHKDSIYGFPLISVFYLLSKHMASSANSEVYGASHPDPSKSSSAPPSHSNTLDAIPYIPPPPSPPSKSCWNTTSDTPEASPSKYAEASYSPYDRTSWNWSPCCGSPRPRRTAGVCSTSLRPRAEHSKPWATTSCLDTARTPTTRTALLHILPLFVFR